MNNVIYSRLGQSISWIVVFTQTTISPEGIQSTSGVTGLTVTGTIYKPDGSTIDSLTLTEESGGAYLYIQDGSTVDDASLWRIVATTDSTDVDSQSVTVYAYVDSDSFANSVSAEQLCWNDIESYIVMYLEREGSFPSEDLDFLIALGNRCLREELNVKQVRKVWTSSDFTITDGVIFLPADIDTIESILWDGYPVDIRTPEYMDKLAEDDWRSTTGSNIEYFIRNGRYLTAYPKVDSISDLVIIGTTNLATFQDGETTSTTPLRYIQSKYQLLPAYYILKEYPAPAENTSAMMRKSEYAATWQRLFNEYKRDTLNPTLKEWNGE